MVPHAYATPDDSPSPTRRRASGAAAIVGGIVWALAPPAAATVYGAPMTAISPLDAPALAGWVLVLVGSVGLHRKARRVYGFAGQSSTYGVWLGMTIVGLSYLLSILALVGGGAAAGDEPTAIHAVFLTGYIITLVASGPLGVALFRLRDPPRLGAALLLVALPVTFFLIDTTAAGWALPYGAAWVVLGVNLWRQPYAYGPRSHRSNRR